MERLMQHLLVVDDDKAVTAVMQTALEADGRHRVTAAPGATEAIAVIWSHPTDAAIIDALLPRISGLALARAVIDLGVPTLIISGDPSHQQLLAEAGCPFLLKPVRISELLAETRMLLENAMDQRLQCARALDRMISAREALAEVQAQSRRLLEASRRFREEVAVRYRVHFVDRDDRVIDATQLASWNDQAAMLEAHRIAIPSIGNGFDVWHGARLVHRYRRRAH
jgi:DNA-binding response OmpR family regulator